MRGMVSLPSAASSRSYHIPEAFLRVTPAAPGSPTELPRDRSLLYGCALLRFDFYYGVFLRWMGGEYTNRLKYWTKMFHTMVSACDALHPLTYPQWILNGAIGYVPKACRSKEPSTAPLLLFGHKMPTIITRPSNPIRPTWKPSLPRKRKSHFTSIFLGFPCVSLAASS
jgi:hypothetical protein